MVAYETMEKTKLTESSANMPKKKNGGARPGAGAPAFQPTDEEREQVEMWAGLGTPVTEMAALIRHGIDEATLVKAFKKDIKRGKAKANIKVRHIAHQQALAGQPTLVIWWEKSRGGMKEEEADPVPQAAPNIVIYIPPEAVSQRIPNHEC